MTRQHDGDPEAYRKLTTDLTNMHHTERTALDESPVYHDVLRLVEWGDYATAVWTVATLRTPEGDAWRKRAFESGLISTESFSRGPHPIHM